jgi:CelD/BcsL family acetyltransferase involved in cellulose biosynthesis
MSGPREGAGNTILDAPPQQPETWCEIVTDFRKLEQLWSAWQRHARHNQRTEIFQHLGWVRAFWKAYGDGLSVYSPVVHQQGLVIGVLPLVRGRDVVEFLGMPDSDYNDLLCNESDAPVALEATLSSLLQSPADWKSCILDNLPSDSQIVRHLGALPPRLRSHLQLVFRDVAPRIVQGETRETLNAICRKGQHPCYRKLQKFGRLTFRHLETREEAREHLPVLFDQHITRWAMSAQRSAFLQPEVRTLYEALIEELNPQTELRFGVLELNSEPIAYHLGFQVKGKFTLYKPAFSIRYWDYSPGDILLRSLFQYAREVGVEEFDFSIGDESYKYRYANQVKQNYTLYVERHPARVGSCLNALARHGKHIVRQKPTMRRVAKIAIQRLNAIISHTSRLGHGGLLRRYTEVLRTVFHKIIWRRDETLVLSGCADSAGAVPGVEIIPANLDILARLSLRYPEVLTEKKLRDCRARLKNGDLVLLARREDEEDTVLWLHMSSGIFIPDLASDLKFPLATPVIVVCEIWTPPYFRPGNVSSEVLRALMKHSEHELWICCLRRQRSLLQVLENAGFQKRYSVRHRALLHWFHHTQISSIDEISDGQQQQPVNEEGSLHVDRRACSSKGNGSSARRRD